MQENNNTKNIVYMIGTGVVLVVVSVIIFMDMSKEKTTQSMQANASLDTLLSELQQMTEDGSQDAVQDVMGESLTENTIVTDQTVVIDEIPEGTDDLDSYFDVVSDPQDIGGEQDDVLSQGIEDTSTDTNDLDQDIAIQDIDSEIEQQGGVDTVDTSMTQNDQMVADILKPATSYYIIDTNRKVITYNEKEIIVADFSSFKEIGNKRAQDKFFTYIDGLPVGINDGSTLEPHVDLQRKKILLMIQAKMKELYGVQSQLF